MPFHLISQQSVFIELFLLSVKSMFSKPLIASGVDHKLIKTKHKRKRCKYTNKEKKVSNIYNILENSFVLGVISVFSNSYEKFFL